MLSPQGSTAATLRHYGAKCDQHLSRVQLSHQLALSSFRSDLETSFSELVRSSFPEAQPDVRFEKMRRGLNEVHLVALKADFELYLNRVLTVVWTAHFQSLAAKKWRAKDVPLRRLADAALEGYSSKEFIVQTMVPEHGLTTLADALELATGIKLPSSLPSLTFSQWSQIRVAFAVRNLIEHLDCRVDSRFLSNVKRFWSNSTWGQQAPLPRTSTRITVKESDVEATCDAMRHAARLLTDVLVQWDSAKSPDGTGA